jgi:hypothetical protein
MCENDGLRIVELSNDRSSLLPWGAKNGPGYCNIYLEKLVVINQSYAAILIGNG